MTTAPARRVHVGPDPAPELEQAVLAAGCALSSLSDAEGVVWFGRDPAELLPRLPAAVTWLQLPDAGVDRWLRAGVRTPGRVVTAARGLYGQQVAEHALALLLGCTRRLGEAACKGAWAPEELRGRVLSGLTVTVVGSGDIGRALLRMLQPLRCRVVMVNRSGAPVDGAALTLSSTRLHEALTGSDALVLAVPSTAETLGMIDAAALACLRPSSVLVNVGRAGTPWCPARCSGHSTADGSRRRRSTSLTPSRCRGTTPCGSTRGSSSPRTPPTRPTPSGRPWPGACGTTANASPAANRSSTSSRAHEASAAVLGPS